MSVTVGNGGGDQDSENLAGNKDCSRYELLNTSIDFDTSVRLVQHRIFTRRSVISCFQMIKTREIRVRNKGLMAK